MNCPVIIAHQRYSIFLLIFKLAKIPKIWEFPNHSFIVQRTLDVDLVKVSQEIKFTNHSFHHTDTNFWPQTSKLQTALHFLFQTKPSTFWGIFTIQRNDTNSVLRNRNSQKNQTLQTGQNCKVVFRTLACDLGMGLKTSGSHSRDFFSTPIFILII